MGSLGAVGNFGQAVLSGVSAFGGEGPDSGDMEAFLKTEGVVPVRKGASRRPISSSSANATFTNIYCTQRLYSPQYHHCSREGVPQYPGSLQAEHPTPTSR